MSDNFGTGQSRVLSVNDRSLDQVVFQDRRVPLTSEWNLINQISDFKTTEAVKINQPSGWLRVGEIKDSGATSSTESVSDFEASAKSGDILTSLTYTANRFKLACRETTNVAVVNGWPIIIQNPGSYGLVPQLTQSLLENDTDSFINLELPPATGTYRYDIVFLEVWRKLVGQSDSVYPYGNVQATPFSNNEIAWDVIGAETTKRVQIQYRIRTYPNSTYGNLLNTELYPDGLGWSNVKPIGGNISGSYVTNSGYYFKSAGPRDIGLYVAGDGSSSAKSILNTVDGYVYAVPMFLAYRRAKNVSYGPNSVHGSNVSRSDLISGKHSDRPDGKVYDVIVADDFVDVRHQLITSGKDLKAVVEDSFRDLYRGDLKTTVAQGFTTNNQKIVCSGGSECVKVEQLNGTGSTLPNIGTGISSGLNRRLYTKASNTHNHNVIEVPINGSTWQAGNINISSFLSSALGTISTVDGFYIKTTGQWDDVTGVTSTTSQITIASGSNLIGTTYTLYMEFTFAYESSNSGFYDVPKDFLEVSKNIYQPIAVRDHDISVRYDNNQQLLTSSTENYVSYRGANYTESYDFGHDLVYHTSSNTSNFSITCTGGKLYNYKILGIKRVQIKQSGSWTLAETFGVTRNTSGSDISFAVTITSTVISSSTEIKVTLITGSGSIESPSESMKFFELSKQGRGVVDIFEMIEVLATPDNPSDLSDGIYTIDTGDKPIIALGSYATPVTGDFVKGRCFGFKVNGASEVMVDILIEPIGGGAPTYDINKYLPVLDSNSFSNYIKPTKIKIQDSTSPPHPNKLRIPVLVHSYIPSTESAYNFYYKFIPYQGLLSTYEERGKIELEGPSIITSLGSGQIKNFTYDNGTVSVTENSREVIKASGDSWKYGIKSGDYFYISGSSYMYRIAYIGTDESGTQSDTRLTLAEPFEESTASGTNYSIIRIEIPEGGISNVIDRMPTYDQEDYKGRSENISISDITGNIITNENKIRLQDPMDSIVNDFKLGASKETGSRGRNSFVLTDGENSNIKLGELSPYIKYGTLSSWTSDKGNKKVYQAYLFNKSYKDVAGKYRDLTGRIYLLVVSSETNLSATEILLNPFSVKDSIDIFELKGRPLIRTA